MSEITEEQIEEIGGLVDSAENFLALFQNGFMPDAMKIDGARCGFETLRDKAKKIYHDLGGEEFKDE